ncbi:hypothetical protein VN12_14010 [Pirellula sp. SH-Sr6A]|uniref:hypothetical protein n=1 Tax=Pirellula sp. SH-Sr6A TaxID=1632865 RepID=UPI00078BDFA1|nr:hypothetical protein [Pirellula sp. SH-Sr6A]AMV33237.1 hypothetical protein VN12_14010 [Pirellula sp. SH-Sr6A]
MRVKKRTSVVESLEVRKVLAQVDWDWSCFVDERRQESDSFILASILVEQNSKFTCVAKDSTAAGQRQPTQAPRGLAGEGEGGNSDVPSGVTNPSGGGIPSQPTPGEQAPTLVTARQIPSIQEAPASPNATVARLEPLPESRAPSVNPVTQTDRLGVSSENQSLVAPIVSLGRQWGQEDRTALNGMATWGIGSNSPFEFYRGSIPPRTLTMDPYAAVDRLMSDSSEDDHWWSDQREWFEERDRKATTQLRGSLLMLSVRTIPSSPRKETPWESAFFNPLPIPSGMVHLEVGQLDHAVIEGVPALTNLAALQSSPFGLLQWFAGGENNANRDNAERASFDRTDMEIPSSSVKESTVDVLWMILVGVFLSERARRAAKQPVDGPLRCISDVANPRTWRLGRRSLAKVPWR